MNPFVKKEIRLLLPAGIVAVLLALVQGFAPPFEPYGLCLLFCGLALMALTTIGREASLNTFSSLLAQPAERIRIWTTKLSVLAAAFLIVFGAWLAAYVFSYFHARAAVSPEVDLREAAYNLFIAICLIAMATFTGGLWTTLLLRRLASSFWLTLLVPAVLLSVALLFLVNSESGSLVIAILSVVIGLYSLAGFLFARRLFFRAQDVGWAGGVITLPEWKFLSAHSGTSEAVRTRQPLLALIKKEIQLQQGILNGAVGLLVLHAGVIGLRVLHKFPANSAGEVLTSIGWMLWLLLPALLGCIAVAEERKLGVMESQLCLPASRRMQFAVKACVTLGLGMLLGGVVPTLLEGIGWALGSPNPTFSSPGDRQAGLMWLLVVTTAFSAWLALLTLFASSLVKDFLQAVGMALLTFVGLGLYVPFGLPQLFGEFEPNPLLSFIIAIPTFMVALVWLAYLNFKNFRSGWPLWRRNLIGVLIPCALTFGGSAAVYHRAWEVFEPAEPAHGPAKLSLANPPELRNETRENLLVRLPDGRVWFDYLSSPDPEDGRFFSWVFRTMIAPLPHSAGPRNFISGSNWADASARHVAEAFPINNKERVYIRSYAESVGIQTDGTLWASGRSDPDVWTADQLTRFGDDADWQQFARGFDLDSVLLLKKNGTLWRWGTNHFEMAKWRQDWPGLRTFQPYQIGADSDWTGVYSAHGLLARKADGSVWQVLGNGRDQLVRETNYDDIVTHHFSRAAGERGTYIRNDGTLWAYGQLHSSNRTVPFEVRQIGPETNWVAAARAWNWLVAVKGDGTLWQWQMEMDQEVSVAFTAPPTRLGIHHDWISVVCVREGIVALAADGSLWLWPDLQSYDSSQFLIRLPKQPRFIANVFDAAK